MMTDDKEKISIQPYLEAVEACLEDLSRAELVDLLLRMAREKSTGQRRKFLTHLQKLKKSRQDPKEPKAVSIESELDLISEWRDEVRQRIELVENGCYEELDDFDYDEFDNWRHYDESPDMISEQQVDEINSVLKRADDLFLDGELLKAKELYEAVSKALREFHDDAFELHGLMEAENRRAKLLRCIYETTGPDCRTAAVAEAMNVDQTCSPDKHNTMADFMFPSLTQIIEARPEQLPDFGRFKTEWEGILKSSRSIRSKVLLIELLDLTGRRDEAEAWLEQHGSEWQWVWAAYVRRAADAEECTMTVDRGKRALEVVRTKPLRAEIADLIYHASKELEDLDAACLGLQTLFETKGGLKYVKRFWQLTDDPKILDRQLRQLEAGIVPDKDLTRPQVCVLLARGRLLDAVECVRDAKILGWSYYQASPLPTVLAGVFLYLSKTAESTPPNVHGFLDFSLEEKASFRDLDDFAEDVLENPDEGPGSTDSRFTSYLIDAIQAIDLDDQDRDRLYAWSKDITRRRVDALVSGKKRKSYWKAGQLAAAWIEMALVNDNRAEAQAFYEEIRHQKYSRFSAFRREFDAHLKVVSGIRQKPVRWGIAPSRATGR